MKLVDFGKPTTGKFFEYYDQLMEFLMKWMDEHQKKIK
jgi:hypothetical protein